MSQDRRTNRFEQHNNGQLGNTFEAAVNVLISHLSNPNLENPYTQKPIVHYGDLGNFVLPDNNLVEVYGYKGSGGDYLWRSESENSVATYGLNIGGQVYRRIFEHNKHEEKILPILDAYYKDEIGPDEAHIKIQEILNQKEIPEDVKNLVGLTKEEFLKRILAINPKVDLSQLTFYFRSTANIGEDESTQLETESDKANAGAGKHESVGGLTLEQFEEGMIYVHDSTFSIAALEEEKNYYKTTGEKRHLIIDMPVTVMCGINSTESSVIYTYENGKVVVEVGKGAGKHLVDGSVTANSFVFSRDNLFSSENPTDSLLQRDLGEKNTEYFVDLQRAQQLARGAVEKEMEMGIPVDVEVAMAPLDETNAVVNVGLNENPTIYPVNVQTRENVKGYNPKFINAFSVDKNELIGKVILAEGIGINEMYATGEFYVLENPKVYDSNVRGKIVITPTLGPELRWATNLDCLALVCPTGSKNAHMCAQVGDKMPVIVGARGTEELTTGKIGTIITEGDKTIIYSGDVPFQTEKVLLSDIPETKTDVGLITGVPDIPGYLPWKNVDLTRMEQLVAARGLRHPLEYVFFERIQDPRVKLEILSQTMRAGFTSPEDFFVFEMANSLCYQAHLAGPNRLIKARFFNIDQGEYPSALDGDIIPLQEDPSLGFIGVKVMHFEGGEQMLRLYAEILSEVKRRGYTNVLAFYPNASIAEEVTKAMKMVEKYGYSVDSEKGVAAMIEIPSMGFGDNISILAENGVRHFSAGNNDLMKNLSGSSRKDIRMAGGFNLCSPEFIEFLQIVRSKVKRAGDKNKFGTCGNVDAKGAKVLVQDVEADHIGSVGGLNYVRTKRVVAEAEANM